MKTGRPPNLTPAWERVLAGCVWVGDCLIWQGYHRTDGYAQIRVGARKPYVHRVVYEHAHGPVPPGLQLDHVKARGCRSRACCNVAHLEVVTCRENLRRGDSFSALNATKTHCPNGHPLVTENLIPSMLTRGRRECRICRSTAKRARRRQDAA